MTEDDVRKILRELRDEPVPADSLARVRLAVAERHGAPTPTRSLVMRWKSLCVAAAAVIAVLLAVFFRPVQPPAAFTAKIQQDIAADPAPPVRMRGPAHVAKSQKAAKRGRALSPEANSQTALIRIETTDPNVVILLVGN